MKLSKHWFSLVLAAAILCHPVSAELVISEFLARNDVGLLDEDDRYSDWIEIANTGAESVSLEGWTLSDNPDNLRKWKLPAVTIEANARRIIFASGKDRSPAEGEWHTNFQLSARGEYLALTMPDGETVASSYDGFPQFDDISYGMDGSTGETGYLNSVSPGESNGGLHYPGPVISDVTWSPDSLVSGEDVVVSARITARSAEIAEVTLHSRVDHGTEATSTMRDDGEREDNEAGDGVFTAVISGRTLFGPRIQPGHMVRWAISATDTADNPARLPVFLDREGVEQSPEYFGTVAQTPDIQSAAPLFEWFTLNEGPSRTRAGARASVYFQGRFYDNVYVRQRGGATNGQSQKFNFSNAFPVFVNDDLPAAKELNLNAQGSDPTYLRQTLAFETYSWAGNATCLSHLTLMRLNGEPDRTGVLIEQVDDVFLDRHGFDPEGDLYKLVQRSNLNPVFADTTTGIEKKTGDTTDLASIAALVDGLDLEGAELETFLFDSINLPQVMNYLAVRSITQDADDVRKNFYVYNDTLGNREWSIFPWDKDWTFGVTGDGGQHLRHPFFGDEAHRKDNANQWNKLYDALFGVKSTRDMYLRRLRTCMDAFLQEEDTPLAERWFENRVAELQASGEGTNVPGSAATTVNRFFPQRRRDLYETYSGLVPSAQEPAPLIEIAQLEVSPESGNQDEEFILLKNPNAAAVDISGWILEGAVEFVFAKGTVIPGTSIFMPGLNELYVSPNVNVFRARSVSPTGGEGNFVQGPYNGHLSNRGETLVLKTPNGTMIDEETYEGSATETQMNLLLSEIMYHPATPHNDAEYIELFNASDTISLDLSGLRFTSGIEFAFAEGTMLAPGEYLVLTRDRAAFAALYGDQIPVAGEFANATRLNNGGERIKLDDADSNTIFEVRYDDEDPWPRAADGQGSSLALKNPVPGVNHKTVTSWGAENDNGSPGAPGVIEGNPDLIDSDRDGIVALLEEWFGTSDTDPNSGPHAFRVQIEGGNLVVRSKKSGVAGDLTAQIESSTDLVNWNDAENAFERTSEEVENVAWEIWTGKDGLEALSDRFYRLRVTR